MFNQRSLQGKRAISYRIDPSLNKTPPGESDQYSMCLPKINLDSLNDCIEKEPNYLEFISKLLNKFRQGKYGVISDIRRAFLQILFINYIWEVCETAGYAYTLASENIFAEIHREIKNVYENGAEITDLSVSFDGTWLTRGHTSLIGVGCVIDMLTGYVVDFEVMKKVYGPDIVIKKEECINHVSKRLGSALRSTVKDCRAQDAKPQHSKCPAGENSWCFYQSAIANGEKPNNHKLNVGTPINEKFLPKILPIYQRLASNELLERCIRCGTQNANEKVTTVGSLLSTERGVVDGPCLDQDQIPVVERERRSRYERILQQAKRLDYR
ncbi:uncharacterized protein TNCV_2234991 [Trichonephila clavipes]|nr:uncharacterized protein TNCV_2234991 [Trichonephila clavipes]